MLFFFLFFFLFLFFFSLEGRETERKLNKKLTCWSSPDSRHSWTCLTFLTTVKSYNRDNNIYQINLGHQKPWRISKSNRFDKGDDLKKSGMKITKLGKDIGYVNNPRHLKKLTQASIFEVFMKPLFWSKLPGPLDLHLSRT